MEILAIDPGPLKSAYIFFDDSEKKILEFGIENNSKFKVLLNRIYKHSFNIYLIIEQIKSYGMPAGDTLFETCTWVGRFIQIWEDCLEAQFRDNSKTYPQRWHLIPRKTIANYLCYSATANDANIKKAVISRFAACKNLGGGKNPPVGIKSNPGPLYGISKDVWSALGIALTFSEICALQTLKTGKNISPVFI